MLPLTLNGCGEQGYSLKIEPPFSTLCCAPPFGSDSLDEPMHLSTRHRLHLQPQNTQN